MPHVGSGRSSAPHGRRSLEVGHAGRATLRINPTKTGRRLLKRHRKLRLVLTVTFTPRDGGTPKTRMAHATVRA